MYSLRRLNQMPGHNAARRALRLARATARLGLSRPRVTVTKVVTVTQ